jgi:hypothetical protein
MFRGMSWVRRAGVAVALLVSLCASTASLPHTNGTDDIACNPVAVAHDASAHGIRSATTPSPTEADHCFLCHSLRSFYSAFDRFEHHDHTPHAERLHAAQVDRSGLVAWTLVPGRAPPV